MALEFPFDLLRPADLLFLRIGVINLALGNDGGTLERVDPAAPAVLIFELPGQHIQEQPFSETAGGPAPADAPPVKALMAAPSRLAFTLPEDRATVPFTIDDLLTWSSLRPRLAPNALPAGARGPGVPGPMFPFPDSLTGLELPYRLLLSPLPDHRWEHRRHPFDSAAGRTELWHTRLVPQPPAGEPNRPDPQPAPMPLRAVSYRQRPYGSAPDGTPRPGDVLYPASTVTRDLRELVTLTSDFSVRTILPGNNFEEWLDHYEKAKLREHPFVPRALQAEHLILSSLGASARIRGDFAYPYPDQDADALKWLGMPTTSLLQYEQVTGLGRDQFVRIVRRGFLCTGQRATIVKITERRFEPKVLDPVRPGPNAPLFGSVGYLRQYYQIVVQEPVIDFAALAGGYPHAGREMGIRRLELLTLVTPKLDITPDPDELETLARLAFFVLHDHRPPDIDEEIDLLGQVAADVEKALTEPFWVEAGKVKVPFSYVATDWDGRTVSGTLNLMFVPYETAANKASSWTNLDKRYNRDTAVTDPARRSELRGQRFALARPPADEAGSTAIPTDWLTFELLPVRSGAVMPATYWMGWLFSIRSTTAHLEPAEQLTGKTTLVELRAHPTYLSSGLETAGNAAGVYATIEPTMPAALTVAGERSGAVGRPDAALEVVSNRQGPMPAAYAKPTIDAGDLAKPFAKAKIFGTFALTDLLGDLGATSPADFETARLGDDQLDQRLDDGLVRVPVLRSRPLVDQGQTAPWGVETRYVWTPPLLVGTTGGFAEFVLTQASRLIFDARYVTPFDPARVASADVRGELRSFGLRFAGVIEIGMDRLAFLARPGRKPDLTAEGVSLSFAGDLQFVNTLQDLLPVQGFSDPPAIEVTSDGISAGFSLGVPNVEVGIFSLQNLSLGARLSVPFAERPAGLRLALSERHHPFLVTVALFGGGGFLSIGVGAAGVDEIEASIEFGGNVSLNLGVASGGVYVMAGVYFGKVGRASKLTGYFRCGGYLDVLGIISISVEFYLGFTFQHKASGGNEIFGEASVTVSVKVCGISKSVSLSVQKRLAGSGGDPTLDQVLTVEDWVDYCGAFAAEVGA